MRGFVVRRQFLLGILSTAPGLALLLSNLPTPSFVLDIGALQKKIRACSEVKEGALPSLYIGKHNCTLFPLAISAEDDGVTPKMDREAPPINITFDASTQETAIGFLHSSVTRTKEEAVVGRDDPVETFLCEIDLSPKLCGGGSDTASSLATLVLGLNNHHVGSYYWARSAGAGASMDAPGVLYDGNDESCGILRWETIGGPMECNTNDGKRSEWVNFLRKGDTVQLVPAYGQDAVVAFLEHSFDRGPSRIFGVSNQGRPLGSEPQVVCEWRRD